MVHRAAEPASTNCRGVIAIRAYYLRVLTWAFTLFSSARVIAYLPTLWAIHQSGDTSQHSLLTWCAWLGSNVTMAAWLHEQSGHVVNRAVGVNIANAGMCLATVALITWHRI
jgi:hypothetical protein